MKILMNSFLPNTRFLLPPLIRQAMEQPCIQEELCQRKFIETFRCNVKLEIGDYLLLRAGHSNQAFSKARIFEGEF